MLIHRVNARDPPMMNIAACIVGMQRAGMRRTVAAVTPIASDSLDPSDKLDRILHVNPETSCKSCLTLPEAKGAVVAAGDEAGVVG